VTRASASSTGLADFHAAISERYLHLCRRYCHSCRGTTSPSLMNLSPAPLRCRGGVCAAYLLHKPQNMQPHSLYYLHFLGLSTRRGGQQPGARISREDLYITYAEQNLFNADRCAQALSGSTSSYIHHTALGHPDALELPDPYACRVELGHDARINTRHRHDQDGHTLRQVRVSWGNVPYGGGRSRRERSGPHVAGNGAGNELHARAFSLLSPSSVVLAVVCGHKDPLGAVVWRRTRSPAFPPFAGLFGRNDISAS